MQRPVARSPTEFIAFIADSCGAATGDIGLFRPGLARAADIEEVLEVRGAVEHRDAFLPGVEVDATTIATAFNAGAADIYLRRHVDIFVLHGHLVVASGLFAVGQNKGNPGAVVPVTRANRQVTLDNVDVVVHRQTHLLEIVGALHTTRSFTRGLDRRQ